MKQGTMSEAIKQVIDNQLKQETLEEAAENRIKGINVDTGFRIERSYSEEDLKTAFLDGWQLRDGDLPFPKAKKKWLEQFKKK